MTSATPGPGFWPLDTQLGSLSQALRAVSSLLGLCSPCALQEGPWTKLVQERQDHNRRMQPPLWPLCAGSKDTQGPNRERGRGRGRGRQCAETLPGQQAEISHVGNQVHTEAKLPVFTPAPAGNEGHSSFVFCYFPIFRNYKNRSLLLLNGL